MGDWRQLDANGGDEGENTHEKIWRDSWKIWKLWKKAKKSKEVWLKGTSVWVVHPGVVNTSGVYFYLWMLDESRRICETL